MEDNALFITKVMYKNPATIVFWSDGTKTISKIRKDSNDVYSKDIGLKLCVLKKFVSPSFLCKLTKVWVPNETKE